MQIDESRVRRGPGRKKKTPEVLLTQHSGSASPKVYKSAAASMASTNNNNYGSSPSSLVFAVKSRPTPVPQPQQNSEFYNQHQQQSASDVNKSNNASSVAERVAEAVLRTYEGTVGRQVLKFDLGQGQVGVGAVGDAVEKGMPLLCQTIDVPRASASTFSMPELTAAVGHGKHQQQQQGSRTANNRPLKPRFNYRAAAAAVTPDEEEKSLPATTSAPATPATAASTSEIKTPANQNQSFGLGRSVRNKRKKEVFDPSDFSYSYFPRKKIPTAPPNSSLFGGIVIKQEKLEEQDREREREREKEKEKEREQEFMLKPLHIHVPNLSVSVANSANVNGGQNGPDAVTVAVVPPVKRGVGRPRLANPKTKVRVRKEKPPKLERVRKRDRVRKAKATSPEPQSPPSTSTVIPSAATVSSSPASVTPTASPADKKATKNDMCNSCKRFRNIKGHCEKFLLCSSCQLFYHPSCSNLTREAAIPVRVSGTWKCANCKLCNLCKEKLGTESVECSRCSSSFHLKCLNMEKKPKGSWDCDSCASTDGSGNNLELDDQEDSLQMDVDEDEIESKSKPGSSKSKRSASVSAEGSQPGIRPKRKYVKRSKKGDGRRHNRPQKAMKDKGISTKEDKTDKDTPPPTESEDKTDHNLLKSVVILGKPGEGMTFHRAISPPPPTLPLSKSKSKSKTPSPKREVEPPKTKSEMKLEQKAETHPSEITKVDETKIDPEIETKTKPTLIAQNVSQPILEKIDEVHIEKSRPLPTATAIATKSAPVLEKMEPMHVEAPKSPEPSPKLRASLRKIKSPSNEEKQAPILVPIEPQGPDLSEGPPPPPVQNSPAAAPISVSVQTKWDDYDWGLDPVSNQTTKWGDWDSIPDEPPSQQPSSSTAMPGHSLNLENKKISSRPSPYPYAYSSHPNPSLSSHLPILPAPTTLGPLTPQTTHYSGNAYPGTGGLGRGEYPQNPTLWTPTQVEMFFRDHGLRDEGAVFREQEIDGISLMLMRRSDIVQGMRLKLGPALKVHRLVVELQNRSLNDAN